MSSVSAGGHCKHRWQNEMSCWLYLHNHSQPAVPFSAKTPQNSQDLHRTNCLLVSNYHLRSLLVSSGVCIIWAAHLLSILIHPTVPSVSFSPPPISNSPYLHHSLISQFGSQGFDWHFWLQGMATCPPYFFHSCSWSYKLADCPLWWVYWGFMRTSWFQPSLLQVHDCACATNDCMPVKRSHGRAVTFCLLIQIVHLSDL